jgi:hypothetical protein
MSDVPESVIKSVWEIDTFIIGLAQKFMKQMTLDSYLNKHCKDSQSNDNIHASMLLITAV